MPMLDGHFYFGGKRVAIAAGARPAIRNVRSGFIEMGCKIQAASDHGQNRLCLKTIPVDEVLVGGPGRSRTTLCGKPI